MTTPEGPPPGRRAANWRRPLSRGAVVLLTFTGVAGSFILSFRPPMGRAVPTSAAGIVVPPGTDPGLYTTAPPTSGPHFPTGLLWGEHILAFPCGLRSINQSS